MPPSSLKLAIERGMGAEADLADELRALGDYTIRTRQDAEAICDALRRFPLSDSGRGGITSPLYALAGLFQDVEDQNDPAFAILQKRGTAELVRIADLLLREPPPDSEDDLLFLLKVLAMYGTRDGAERIIAAARKPLEPDAYMWSVILGMFRPQHPQRALVFNALLDPLPEGFIAIAFLDAANECAREGALGQHPFDSPKGRERLREWLTGRDPGEYSYAHSATAALPFISRPEREELLALAMDHPEVSVQMEAAWASARLGSDAGLKMLARWCLEPDRYVSAEEYLRQLNRLDLVPEAARSPDFQAKAQFAHWLAHPNELGRPPDEVEIVDHRTLVWPPGGEQRDFWLIKYVARDPEGLDDDDIDCGVVGSVTFCFFSYKMHERPPEDAYAIHCYWEMEHEKLITEMEVDDSTEYAAMLQQWTGAPLSDVEIVRVAELSPPLKQPQKMVAMATAMRGNDAGWVVLDGPHSRWYSKSEMPADVYDSTVLMLHVGRQLLGFTQEPDRGRFLAPPQGERDPHEIVAAYERLFQEARGGTPSRKKTLLTQFGNPLGRHFIAYVDARARISGESRVSTLIAAYQELMDLAASADNETAEDVYGTGSALDRNFDDYVDALIASDRSSEVTEAIELFGPHWGHNRGYSTLGSAAHRAGDHATAERYLLRLRESYDDWFRSDDMDILARIWHTRGDDEQAHDLLIACLRGTARDSRSAKGSDRKLYEEWFQNHRSTYLELFPERGDAFLAEQGIPTTTLK